MASELKHRRGTTAQHSNFTGAIGEFTYDTDKKSIVTHDGTTLGGFPGGGFRQAGTSVVRSVETRLRQTVSVKDFGAVGNGVTDDTAAIQAAIDYAATLTAPILIVDAGEYYTTAALYFTLPNYSTIQFIGRIKANVSAQAAVVIGSVDSSAAGNRFGYHVTGLKVYRTSIDSAGTSIGVQLRSIVASYVEIRECRNFRDGVYCYGVSPNGGFSYNEIHLGYLHDNRTNLHLAATGVGYCNENNFFGGTYNHTSAFPAVSTINLEIDHFALNNLNFNRFWGPSFEDNSALAVAAVVNGFNNVIYNPRMENLALPTTYKIIFAADSDECKVFGYGIVKGNIQNNGLGNSWETRDGIFTELQTQTAADDAVYRARSQVTNSVKVFRADDVLGAVSAYMAGDGLIYANDRVYAEEGIRFKTSDATYNDRGLFAASTGPEGSRSANPGSIASKTSGGAGQSLWVKESGAGNTGWKAIITQPEVIAAADIAAVGNAINTTDKFTGKLVWDSTNNRMMRSSGSAAASAWYVIDGSASVTPS